MKTSIEKVKECYVLCSLDLTGNTVYLLRSVIDSKWIVTADPEIATKCADKETAEILRDLYMREIGDATWVIVPMIIQYHLVNEE